MLLELIERLTWTETTTAQLLSACDFASRAAGGATLALSFPLGSGFEKMRKALVKALLTALEVVPAGLLGLSLGLTLMEW